MPKVEKRPCLYITEEDFIAAHGEVMRQCRVAKLIDVSPQTVCVMCSDGRLEKAPEGGVLMRSLYAHLYPPKGKRLRVAR